MCGLRDFGLRIADCRLGKNGKTGQSPISAFLGLIYPSAISLISILPHLSSPKWAGLSFVAQVARSDPLGKIMPPCGGKASEERYVISEKPEDAGTARAGKEFLVLSWKESVKCEV